MTTILDNDVTTETQLSAAIDAANSEGAGAYEIDLGSGASIALTSDLPDLDLNPAVSVDIEGDGGTLNGGGTQRGLYVYAGAVTVENLTLENNATGGAGGALILGDDGATPASVTLTNVGFLGGPPTGGTGGDIFVQSGATLVLAPSAGQTEMISGLIAGANGQPGSGALVLDGGGALALSGANTFTGGITVDAGTLVLSAVGAAGSGAVSLSGGAVELTVNGAAAAGGVSFGAPLAPATVLIDVSASPGVGQTEPTAMTDFGPGDAIDIAGLTYATGATASLVGSTLTVNSGGQSAGVTLVTPTAVGFSVQNDGAGHALVTTQVMSEADLNAAIAAADSAAANSGALEIDLGGNIALSSALNAINLKSGVTLDIEGGNFALDGGGAQRGLFVYSGVVTIENLTLKNMVATGGAGASGGGGGAGLGGGLFVADDSADGAAPGAVTLTNVNFANDSAVGGAGTDQSHILAGGGGGMGGVGGAAGGTGGAGGGTGGGGGGGVGSAAAGGGSGSNSGQTGIILGAALAGAGGSHSPAVGGAGGAAGGGGGGSGNLGAQSNGGGGGGVGGGASGVFVGGVGGFGGGGGGDKFAGGAGGFGGGGGSGYTGGKGGFGGGGGGAGYFGGTAGFGGGTASYLFYTNGLPNGAGGGGLGAGGDIFVQQGASLTIAGGSQLTGGSATGGAAGPASGVGGKAGSPGHAYAGGIFLQGNQSLTFAPGAAQTVTVSGVIADMTGSHDASHQTGAGALVLNGAGVLVLSATNTFTGGVTLDQGVLELSAAAAAGAGTISFAAGAVATLKIDQGLSPGNLVSGFGVGDVIDLAGAGTEASFTYSAATNALVASGGSRSVSLAVAPPPTGADFTLAADGHGGTSIGASMVLAPTLSLVGQPVNGHSAQFSGTGRPGATVTLYADGGTTAVGAGVVAAGGGFTITTTAAFADGSHSLTAMQTTPDGVTGASTTLPFSVAPTTPTILVLVGQPVNGGTIELKGAGEVGTTVSLYADGGTIVVGSGVVSAGGTFDIVTTATFADGSHALAAMATDAAGVASAPSASFAVPVDPTAPTITTLVGQPADSGTIEVQGTGEAGTTVSLYADGGTAVAGFGLVSAGGTFDIVTTTTFADGGHILVGVAMDSAALASGASPSFAVPVEPTTPAIMTLVGQPVNGGAIEVQGIGEAGTVVSLYADGGMVAAGSGVVSAGGTFDIVTSVTVADGSHSLVAVAMDGSGLSSGPSAPFAVPVDPTAPTVTTLVGQPVNGGTIEVQGTGEAGTTVSLYADGGTAVVGSGLVSAGGTFDIVTKATFADGGHALTAQATGLGGPRKRVQRGVWGRRRSDGADDHDLGRPAGGRRNDRGSGDRRGGDDGEPLRRRRNGCGGSRCGVVGRDVRHRHQRDVFRGRPWPDGDGGRRGGPDQPAQLHFCGDGGVDRGGDTDPDRGGGPAGERWVDRGSGCGRGWGDGEPLRRRRAGGGGLGGSVGERNLRHRDHGDVRRRISQPDGDRHRGGPQQRSERAVHGSSRPGVADDHDPGGPAGDGWADRGSGCGRGWGDGKPLRRRRDDGGGLGGGVGGRDVRHHHHGDVRRRRSRSDSAADGRRRFDQRGRQSVRSDGQAAGQHRLEVGGQRGLERGGGLDRRDRPQRRQRARDGQRGWDLHGWCCGGGELQPGDADDQPGHGDAGPGGGADLGGRAGAEVGRGRARQRGGADGKRLAGDGDNTHRLRAGHRRGLGCWGDHGHGRTAHHRGGAYRDGERHDRGGSVAGVGSGGGRAGHHLLGRRLEVEAGCADVGV